MAAISRKGTFGRAGAIGLAFAGIAFAASAQTHDGWEQELGTLRVGIVSPSGGRGLAGLRQMTIAFERAAGVPVEILVARDYPALIRAQAQGRIHYAVQSAIAYAATYALCVCVEPVAAPRGIDGAIGLRAVIIARRERVGAMDEMIGARVVAGPVENPGPQAIALAGIGDAVSTGSVVHAASYSEAERIFRDRAADVLIGWEPVYDDENIEPLSGTLARLVAAGTLLEDVTVVWSSQTIAYGPHTVRSDLPDELKQRLRRFLVNLREQQPDVYHILEPHRGGGFVEVDAELYAPARKLAARLGTR